MSGESNQGDPQSPTQQVQSTYLKIFNNVKNLDIFNPKYAGSGYLPNQEAKGKEIETSKAAKGHFFTQDYVQKYKSAVEKDEKLKEKQFEALDSIDYYNKKYMGRDKLQKLHKIPGSFFKVRSQGGASGKDIDEVNKFYKRSFITMFMLMLQSYATINFLYDGRFITQRRLPRVFTYLPWVVYPTALLGSCVFMF